MKTWCPPLGILGLAACTLALPGCGPSGPSGPSEDAAFGRFEGSVVAAWDDDGRNMTLREEFRYIDQQNRTWVAPAGSVVNGASIPAAFWSLIGGPFEGKYRNASVVHDVECVNMTSSWEDVHRMFYEACRCSGVDEAKAKVMYYAVYHFGPRWQPAPQVALAPRIAASDGATTPAPAAAEMVRIDPPPPTLEEVQQVQALILEEDPEPAAIERIDRKALHRRPPHAAGRGRPGGDPAAPGEAAGRAGRGTLRTADEPIGNRPPRPEPPRAETVILAERLRPPHAKPAGNGLRGLRPPRTAAPPDLPDVPVEEQQWAAERVSEYLEQQTGQQRPAEYAVERTTDGYRIRVRYRVLDAEGLPTTGVRGSSDVRLSPDGRVLEMVSGP